MKNALRGVCAVFASLALSACAAFNNSHIGWPGPNGSRVLSVDAKQRHLVMAPFTETTRNGTVIKSVRTCSEAAPDVFSAFSSSFSGNGLFGPTQNDVEAAASVAEAAATIERTQTINMLRETMYRTCERWLNGALTKEQFIVQAARDQQTMLAILAIEQLTGAVKAKSTIISGPSTSAAIANGEEMAKLITDFNKDYQAAKTAQSSAATALDDANKTGKCVGAADKPDGVDTNDWATCQSAQKLKNTKDTELADAKTQLSNVISASNTLSGGANASTTALTAQTAAAQKPDGPTIAVVAKAVENIATSPAIDEVLMFCIAYLSNTERTFNAADTTRATCNLALGKAAQQELNYRSKFLGDEEAGAGAGVRDGTDRAFRQSSDRVSQLLAKIMMSANDETAEAGMAHLRSALNIGDDELSPCTTKTACTALVENDEPAFRSALGRLSASAFANAISKF